MCALITTNEITLFKSIFKGREDVFALRWEKNGKNGYMPAYSFDPYMYKLHRMKGGTFQNYSDKQYQAAFKHLIPQINTEQEFEVENIEMRPEFHVLKPYFAKILKKKKVKIDVLAKFHNGVPVIHTASSHDLTKINREIIDSVKFQFVSKGIFGKIPKGEDNLLDLNQVQDEQRSPLYSSEKELLDDILKNKNVKHHRQLVYLSEKHESNILKLRFVLYPFSFVFLLSGMQQYHIIWETLDTEEATYVWHVDKKITALKGKLKEIDSYIGKIRTTGRQEYLGSQTDGFSRIVHDYSDERKGFVIWKDLLEERLT